MNGEGRKGQEFCPEDQDQPQNPVGAYPAVFHDSEDTVPVPSASESVAHIGKTVFVKTAREQNGGGHGKNNSHGDRE